MNKLNGVYIENTQPLVTMEERAQIVEQAKALCCILSDLADIATAEDIVMVLHSARADMRQVEAANMDLPPPSNKVRELVRAGRRIPAITAYKIEADCGLWYAKAIVDRLGKKPDLLEE